jgi:hypothetical protein
MSGANSLSPFISSGLVAQSCCNCAAYAKKAHLQIRCDEGLRDGLRAAARKDGLLVAAAARRALETYINVRPMPLEAVWTAIAALASQALSPAGIKGFIASLEAYDKLEQMGRRPASDGIALVTKVLSERNLDV